MSVAGAFPRPKVGRSRCKLDPGLKAPGFKCSTYNEDELAFNLNRVPELAPLHEGVDLGASWTWPPHESRVASYAKEHGIDLVPQRLDGGVRHPGGRAPGGGDRMAPCGPGAYRLNGGYAALAEALRSKLPEGSVHLGVAVSDIERGSDGAGIVVRTGDGNEYTAATAIVAVPPRVAAGISFSPALSEDQADKMNATATWAGDWCKVVATFSKPFWREAQDSGVAQMPRTSHASVTWEASEVPQLGEACNALAGVNFGADACARLAAHASDLATGNSAPELKKKFGAELESVFGVEAKEQLLEVYHCSWMSEPLTYGPAKHYRELGGDPRSGCAMTPHPPAFVLHT